MKLIQLKFRTEMNHLMIYGQCKINERWKIQYCVTLFDVMYSWFVSQWPSYCWLEKCDYSQCVGHMFYWNVLIMNKYEYGFVCKIWICLTISLYSPRHPVVMLKTSTKHIFSEPLYCPSVVILFHIFFL